MSDKVVRLEDWRSVAVIDGGRVTRSTDPADIGKDYFFVTVTNGPLRGLMWEGERLDEARIAARDMAGTNGRIIERCADGS